MGRASKMTSVFLRVMELISAAVVAGLVGEYLHYVSNAHGAANSRMVYTEAILELVFSLPWYVCRLLNIHFSSSFSIFLCSSAGWSLLDFLSMWVLLLISPLALLIRWDSSLAQTPVIHLGIGKIGVITGVAIIATILILERPSLSLGHPHAVNGELLWPGALSEGGFGLSADFL